MSDRPSKKDALASALAGSAFMALSMGIYLAIAADGQPSVSTRVALDASMPLSAGWVWIYISVYFVTPFLVAAVPRERVMRGLGRGAVLMGLSFAVFWLYPTHVDRPDLQLLEPSLSRDALAFVYSLDTPPRNAAPSGHVSLVILLAWTTWTTRHRGFLLVYSTLVSASIVIVGQHHVLDLVSGGASAFLVLAGLDAVERGSPRASRRVDNAAP